MKIFILIFLSFCLFVLSAGDTQEEDYNNQYEGTLGQLPMKDEKDNEPQYKTTLNQPPIADQAPLDEAQENYYVTNQGSSVHV